MPGTRAQALAPPPMLDLLPDDLLLPVLAPFDVATHGVLMSVCKRWNAMLLSEAFHGNRRLSGHAQYAVLFHGGVHCNSGAENWSREILMSGADEWRRLANYPGKQRLDGCEHVKMGDEEFYFGGHQNGNYTYDGKFSCDCEQRVFAYSMTRDAWRLVTHSPLLDLESSICRALGDGTVIIAGGAESAWFSAAKSVWLFDPSAIDPSIEDKMHDSYVEWSKASSRGLLTPDQSAQYWAQRGWTRLPDMPYAVMGAWRSFVSDFKLFVVRGCGDDGTSWDHRLRSRGAADYDEWRENKPVSWIQAFDCATYTWQLLDAAPPNPSAEAEPLMASFSPRVREALKELGVEGRYSDSAVTYEGGILVLGDCSAMAFVDSAADEVSLFEPDLKMIRPSLDLVDSHRDYGMLDGPRLDKMELHADSVHVRRMAKSRA